jgi:SlyX protein
MSVEERLIDLEIRLVHQDKTIATLDDVVREFAARVERLERQLAEVRRSHEALESGSGTPHERPPHY